MSRGIKRRCSASKFGDLEDPRGSQAGGRLRKRARHEKASRVLRGGLYTSKFGWPYNPVVSDQEIAQWFKRMDKPIRALISTRLGSNRGSYLVSSEVRELDAVIEAKLRHLDDLSVNHASYDMMAELQSLFRFINLVVVTNLTPDTTIQLSNNPLVYTGLEYNLPVALRVEDVYSGGPIVLFNWRSGSGSTRQNSEGREINVKVDSLKFERKEEKLIVRVPYTGGELMFEVMWFGPEYFYQSSKRKDMLIWSDIVFETLNIPDSFKLPCKYTEQELFDLWFPYIQQLVETKKVGVHKKLPRESFDRMHNAISDRMSLYEQIVKGKRKAPDNFAAHFYLFLRSIRVVNLMPESIVLIRTPIASYMFQHLVVAEVALHLTEIIAAEVHFPKTKEVVPITYNMVTVKVVEDCLEAVINIGKGRLVVLKISWLGPYGSTPDGVEWGEFMDHPRDTSVYSDAQRSRDLNYPPELVPETRGKALATQFSRSWSAAVKGSRDSGM